MELLLEPCSRFLTRAHAFETAFRLSRGDSANPTRTIGVFDRKLRALPETSIERYYAAGDRAWDLQVAALAFEAKQRLTRFHHFTQQHDPFHSAQSMCNQRVRTHPYTH
jgi:hypothetical protein